MKKIKKKLSINQLTRQGDAKPLSRGGDREYGERRGHSHFHHGLRKVQEKRTPDPHALPPSGQKRKTERQRC